jgi:hypothetical protein
VLVVVAVAVGGVGFAGADSIGAVVFVVSIIV